MPLSTGAPSRHSINIRGTPVRNSRDPRPVGDRGFAVQCARNVVDFLASRGYGRTVPQEKFLRDPSTKEFYDIFKFLIAQLDPNLEMDGRMEDEVPLIMRRLRYPVEVNRSKLQAITGPNTWPQLLAVLDWLVCLIQVDDELITPVAECQHGSSDLTNPDDLEDHGLLYHVHENYIQYLHGKADHSDEDRLQQICDERIQAQRDEIRRIQEHIDVMEKELREWDAENDRLAELRGGPRCLEMEADRLRGMLNGQELAVQRAEGEVESIDAEIDEADKEIRRLEPILSDLQEQVDAQTYSKKDIERLKLERTHLRRMLEELQSDTEKLENDVWELGLEESRLEDAVSRSCRTAQAAAEAAEHALAPPAPTSGSSGNGDLAPQDFIVHVDLGEPTDALAQLDLREVRGHIQAAVAAHTEATQWEEAATNEVHDEQRVAQEELSQRERECHRLKLRLEQLTRLRDEHRVLSAAQLDEALRVAETAEDAVHAANLGTAVSSVRDAAQVDELRLTLTSLRASSAVELAQLEEHLRREEERTAEHKRCIQEEFRLQAEGASALRKSIEAAVSGGAKSRRVSEMASRGGS